MHWYGGDILFPRVLGATQNHNICCCSHGNVSSSLQYSLRSPSNIFIFSKAFQKAFCIFFLADIELVTILSVKGCHAMVQGDSLAFINAVLLFMCC